MAERPYQDPYKGRRLPETASVTAAALRGYLGREEPGSVLDPNTAKNKSVNAKVELANNLADLVPPLAGAKALLSLPALAGTFIGKGAKTWDAAAAARAAELLRDGVPPSLVQKYTNTHLFPDGELRQEISDHMAALKSSPVPGATPSARPLDQILDHPELQAAYPEAFAKAQAQVRHSPGIGGEYREGKIKVEAPDLSRALSTMLHETQHGVQDIEKFARGGSSSEFKKDAIWAAKARGKDAAWAKQKAYADYLRLAGEAEARLTQQRRMLTPEERRNTPLQWDVAPEQQRVKFYKE